MADPKYANLYGIAHDQPDIYETNDLPEVDQITNIFEEKSSSVELLSLSTSEAFDVFRGKEADTSVDFSEIGKAKSKNWEVVATGEKETKEQRYTRLKFEIESLIEEMLYFTEDKGKSISELSKSLDVSSQELLNLFNRISDLKLTDKIGSDNVQNFSNFETVQFAKLIDHLNELRKKLANKEVRAEDSEKFDTCVQSTVQVLVKLKPNPRTELTARLSELERKINKLESLVGSTANSTIRLCNANIDNGLVNCCQWMVAKLSLLDTTQLDVMDARVGGLSSRLDQISSLHSGARDVEKYEKVNELYELCSMIKQKSDLISMVVQRMVALKSLHVQGVHSLQTINYLERLQTELAFSLTSNQTKLENVKESMNVNIETIKNDVELLKERINNLKISTSIRN